MQRVPANSLAFLTERLCGTYAQGLVWSLGRVELHATGLLLCNTLAHIIKSTHHCKTVETSTGVSGVATWSFCFRWRSMKTFDLWRKTTSWRVKTNCQVQKQHDRLRECRRVWRHARRKRTCARHTQIIKVHGRMHTEGGNKASKGILWIRNDRKLHFMLQQLVVKMQEILHWDIICEYIVVVKFCKKFQ